jgi:peptide/nickel transport system substrate-binding protein
LVDLNRFVEENEMEIIRRQKKQGYEHPYVPELKELYRQGRISRRTFLRNAALLGVSVASASAFLAACTTQAVPTVAPTSPPPTMPPTPTAVPTATPVPAPVVKRGGVMRFAQRVPGIDHPARFSWGDESEICRFSIQYLTYTDRNNITVPYLLEKWEASEDLKTWTLFMRQGVKWTTGETFGADDVIFTMNEWLNPDVGSSMLGLFSNLSAANVEKVDDYTVKLYLDSPTVAVPENLYHYPGHVLDHRTFEGNWLDNPVGTGPFIMKEWSVGERAVLEARKDGLYWENGADGKPLPYLDGITAIDLGGDETARVSALRDGTIDMIVLMGVGYQVAKELTGVTIDPVTTAMAPVLRVRVDVEPWTDPRVRKALKLCQQRQKILDLAYFGEGMIGGDFHVAPVQPEYCPMDPFPYDPEQAKALLAEAGYPNGIDTTLTVGTGWADYVSFAEILKEGAAPAGIRININAIPNDSYWDVWTTCEMGITGWGHRPLAIMTLPLAYVCDAEGVPVSWNESGWCDEEFSQLLDQAVGTLDIEERRDLMCQIQTIQKERGSVLIPFWKNQWFVFNPKFKGIQAHPAQYMDELRFVWLDA